METYAFWNNKGGTGKTSLAFQSIAMFAETTPNQEVLAIDLCPQANLSELFLGGLLGNGSGNLHKLQSESVRRSVGGYFQARLPSPYTMPGPLQPADFLSHPSEYNDAIPDNVWLLAGDAIVELQANAISTLANTQVPGTNTWLQVIDWLKDFLTPLQSRFSITFVDANPSFSLYTQIALASSDCVILPVMADDSSRRAIQNAFALVHGIDLPSAIYEQHNFHARLADASRCAPRFHLFPKNRLTQYMGPASAYRAVLTGIDEIIETHHRNSAGVFTFSNLREASVEIRDFQTTGVVAFAHGTPFSKLRPRVYKMPERDVQVNGQNIQNCVEAIERIVGRLHVPAPAR